MPASVFASVSALVFTLAMMLGAHPFTETIDWALHGEPNVRFLQASLLGGEIPWWNPYVGLGRPYVSDLQSAVFYPPTYLLFLGRFTGPGFFLVFHAFLAILGMHLLCRQLGGRGVFGLLGGCALLASMGFGGRLLAGHTFYFAGLCYLPMLLWALTQLRLHPTARRTGFLGVLIALQFLTGHPQVFWCSTLGLGLFMVGLLVRPAPAIYWRRIPRMIAGFAAALLLAAGISASAWLPFLDLIAEGNRHSATLKSASIGSFKLAYVFDIVTHMELDYLLNWEHNYRVGFAWVVPGLAGLCMVRSAAVRSLLLMGGTALWFSFGESSWLFRICFDLLPGASSFRLPARINALTILALITSAAVYLSRSRHASALPRIGQVAAVFLMVGVLHAYLNKWASFKLAVLQPLAALLVAVGSVHVWRRQAKWTPYTNIIALVFWLGLQCLELFGAHVRYGSLYSFESVFGMANRFPLAEGLAKTLPSTATGVPARILVPPELIPPNFGLRDHWAHVDSYTALFLKRPWEYLHGATSVEVSTFQTASLSEKIYLRPPFSIPNLSLDVASDYVTGSVLMNTNPIPRLWITFNPRLVGRPEEALAAVTNRLDLPREGVIESALPFPPQTTGEAAGSASILRFRHSEIDVACQLSHPGVLVLNEAWFPGWHTVVAGQRIESQPVNYWMRGFALPAGEHTLKLQFRPRRMAEAIALSIGSLCVGGFLILRGRRFWRRPEALAQ